MQILDPSPADIDDVWRLNEVSVPHVSSVGLEEMQWFARNAHYFRIVRVDGNLGGFLIGLRPGLQYDSPNYRWFTTHYEDFGYVDRVAVTSAAQRRGNAHRPFDDVLATIVGDVEVMNCEVKVSSQKDTSVRFHVSRRVPPGR